MDPSKVDRVFILRFWLEDSGSDEGRYWRAQIRNVNTGRWQIAKDVESALALVAAALADAVKCGSGK